MTVRPPLQKLVLLAFAVAGAEPVLAQKSEEPAPLMQCIAFAEKVEVSAEGWQLPQGAAASEGGDKLDDKIGKSVLSIRATMIYAIINTSPAFGRVERVRGTIVARIHGTAQTGSGEDVKFHDLPVVVASHSVNTRAVSLVTEENRCVWRRPYPVAMRATSDRKALEIQFNDLARRFEAENAGAVVKVNPFKDSNFDVAIKYHGSFLDSAGEEVCRSPGQGESQDIIAVGVEQRSGGLSGSFENHMFR